MPTRLVLKSFPVARKAIVASARAVQRQIQHRPQDCGAPITPSLPEAESAQLATVDAPDSSDSDLIRYAWNGSIPEGAIRTRCKNRLTEVAAARMTNAALCGRLANRIATLEAELSVLVEQPPKSPPQPKVLRINPIFKGA